MGRKNTTREIFGLDVSSKSRSSSKSMETLLVVALTIAKKTTPLIWKKKKEEEIGTLQWLDLLTPQITIEQKTAIDKNQSESIKYIPLF